jgi:hypothetical protein
MSNTKHIPEEQLEKYLDDFSRRFLMRGSQEFADVELIGPEIGDQVVASGVRLLGIDYDPHTRALEILLDGGDRRVYEPREVWTVEDSNGFINSMEVILADGTRQVMKIKQGGMRRANRES